MSDMVRAHAIITGRVQGVFFRLETQRAASNHDVSGWVRNKPDGTVEAIFEGDETDVKSILAWCHQGPPNARVDNVEVTWQDYAGEFSKFEVTY